MRLFDDFQEALAGIASRLACGAPYLDGSTASLLTAPAKSTSAAISLFTTVGRTSAKYPKWSKVSFINDTTKHVLDAGEAFNAGCSANSLMISEMQAVRNRIAHNNSNSRAKYAVIVNRYYGAKLNTVPPGLLLISPKFHPIRLSTYLASCRIILKACTKS